MGQPKPLATPRGAELTAALNDRIKKIRLAYADALEIVAEMQAIGVAAEVGYSSLAAYLVDATNLSRQRANRMVAPSRPGDRDGDTDWACSAGGVAECARCAARWRDRW